MKTKNSIYKYIDEFKSASIGFKIIILLSAFISSGQLATLSDVVFRWYNSYFIYWNFPFCKSANYRNSSLFDVYSLCCTYTTNFMVHSIFPYSYWYKLVWSMDRLG